MTDHEEMRHEKMHHEEIDERKIIEHYVAGKLSAVDEARFEAHYLNCSTCIRAIEDTERLRRGLHGVAAEELAQTTAVVTLLRFLKSRQGALVTAVALVLMLLPVGLARQEIGRLGTALDSLRQELTEERRPRANTPILTLLPTRDDDPPPSPVSLREEPEWVVFAIPLGEEAAASYTAALSRGDGEVVWPLPSTESAETLLEPSYDGTLTLSLLSSLLPLGEYVLELQATEDAPSNAAKRLRFPLRIIRAPQP